MTVETGGADPVEPGQQRGEVRDHRAGPGSGRGRRDDRVGGVRQRRAIQFDRNIRRRSGHERALVGAGKDRDLAVGLDADCHLGADQAQPLGAHMSGKEPGAREADLGLGGGGHDGAVGVAHHDVAHAQRRASIGVALELRAPDLDLMIAAEILFHGGDQPGRSQVEIDRPARQAPPQREHSDADETHQRGGREGALAQLRPAMEQAAGQIQDLTPTRQRRQPKRRQAILHVLIAGQLAGQLLAKVRLEAGLEPPKRAHARIRVLIRHSPTGRPLDRRIPPPPFGPVLVVPWSKIRMNPVDPPALSRVWSGSTLTPKKGRKEGANGEWARSRPEGPGILAAA